MVLRKAVTGLLLAAALTGLAACDTAEERAEKFYQSGLSYLEQGKVDLALVEFRNVFKLNGSHTEARLAYARISRERGDLREAFSQYLRLVEQSPENIEGRRALAELSADAQNWQEVERHVTAGLAAEPGDPVLSALQTAAEYARSVEARGGGEPRSEIVAKARRQMGEQPDNLVLRRVIIDSLLRDQNYPEARREIDAALAIAPRDRGLYAMRLSIFVSQDDDEAIEAQLKEMISVFADDPSMRLSLVRWHVTRGEIDKAEAAMREAVSGQTETPEADMALVRFLAEFRGSDAAIAEVEKLIAGGRDSLTFRSVHAGLLFEGGKTDDAIAEMQTILKDAPATDESHNVKVGLARMLFSTGNSVGARATVEEVLSTDANHVEALKLKATWLINDDATGEAITALRRALDERPRDADILSLMASAYERDGNRALMGEMLALAVEASNKGVAESLRYATSLAQDEKFLPAETVLVDALRMSPGNPELLVPLGRVHVALGDWGRAGQVADTLAEIDSDPARQAAQSLKTAVLQGQQKTSETLGYLESLVESGEGGLGAQLAIVRTHLANDDPDSARAYAADLLASAPEDASLRFLEASVRALTGEAEYAEGVYRKLVQQDPRRLQVWLALYRQLDSAGQKDKAAQALADASAVMPDAPELQWARAGVLERDGDIDGAIAIYESLYAANSDSTLVANNLASLLSTYRTDAASIDRAHTVARRLRDTKFAPFQDTYGWISHLKGNPQEAVGYLEPAAAALKQDPSVQFHLGAAYQALGRSDAAIEQFRKVIALATAEDTRPFVVAAREALAQAGASPAATGN